MKLRVISVGNKCPEWIRLGFDEYAKRMPKEMPLSLTEIAAPKHHQDSGKVNELEAKKILEKIHSTDWVVALDETGRNLSSPSLAGELERWRELGKDVVFVIGGANGLASQVRERANQQLSLSALTFPHYVVRVLIAETLYRAWSISIGHPYHRQ
jgi:23S rRNA (pseudouridine1915-N3)-methyltransferase